jgi:hypothetical protein
MGDSNTEHRRRFTETFEKQLEEELYPCKNPRSKSARDAYMGCYFWAFFDVAHVYYDPAIPGFDKTEGSPPN